MTRATGSKNYKFYKYRVHDSMSDTNTYFVRQSDISITHNITQSLVLRRLYHKNVVPRDFLNLTFYKLDKPIPVYRQEVNTVQ
jgi:hypothetical protein